MLTPAGLRAWAHADHCSGKPSFPGYWIHLPLRLLPLHLGSWAGYFRSVPPCVHDGPSRHCFLSGHPLSMRESMGQMPIQRGPLKNAPTSEGSSNTAPKERWEQRSHLSQTQMTNGAVPGPWWGLVLGHNRSPNLSKKAREMHLPTTEPGNQQP